VMLALDLLVQLLTKDPVTYEHSWRVARLARAMAASISLTEEDTHSLIQGCLFHDIGKLLIPKSLLQSPAQLTSYEVETVKTHVNYGVLLLQAAFVKDVKTLHTVQFHHERWDGSGYPHGRRKQQIPLFARICSILDAYDAMTMDRPFSPALDAEAARRELANRRGTHFDGDMVELFLSLPEALTV